jgi:hypothetical protein
LSTATPHNPPPAAGSLIELARLTAASGRTGTTDLN